MEYLVKWKNLRDDETSWETADDQIEAAVEDQRQQHQIVKTLID